MPKSKTDIVMLGAIENGLRIEKDGTVIGTMGVPVKGSMTRRSKKDKSTRFYLYSSYRYKKKDANVMFHRLQAYTKYGDALFEDGVCTRHGEGGPLDNSWDNITIGTSSDNQLDVPPKKRRAARQNQRRISDDEVREIRKLYAQGDTSYGKLAKKYGVGRMTIRSYVKRRERAYVED